MLKEKIGQDAGLVWNVLEKGKADLKSLKKETKLKEKDLHLALGWLAREGKIAFVEVDEELHINLA